MSDTRPRSCLLRPDSIYVVPRRAGLLVLPRCRWRCPGTRTIPHRTLGARQPHPTSAPSPRFPRLQCQVARLTCAIKRNNQTNKTILRYNLRQPLAKATMATSTECASSVRSRYAGFRPSDFGSARWLRRLFGVGSRRLRRFPFRLPRARFLFSSIAA